MQNPMFRPNLRGQRSNSGSNSEPEQVMSGLNDPMSGQAHGNGNGSHQSAGINETMNPHVNRSLRPRSLVTGGAGFVGSHLCDRLLEKGHEVICCDNVLTGDVQNIEHLRSHPRFAFVRHDVTLPADPSILINRMAEWRGDEVRAIPNLDYVFHLASPASPKHYAQYPLATLRVGALGTWNALELARATGASFLLSSTSEVYGDPEVSPQPETYWGRVNPVGPRSVYDEAKRYAEALTMAYGPYYGLEIRVARIFNTYGARMREDDGRALPNFMMQALRGEPLTVYGDGSQTRSLCYVSDTVEGLLRLMLSDETGPVNIGNPEEITMKELAEKIIQITETSSSILFEPLPQDDPTRRCPDISKAAMQLNWHPQVTLREGLTKVLPYFRSKAKRYSVLGAAAN